MLMILARLVRSESFWAVVKVRSPHTGPEVWYPRQGKWGRGGQPSSVLLGSLRPVRGCVEPSITLGTSGCWK